MGYVKYVRSYRNPSLAQLVEHGTVVNVVGHPRVSGSSPERGILFFYSASLPSFFISFIGKFAQRSNMTKTKLITDPNELFNLLTSKEYVVGDARLVNDDTVEVQYCNIEEFEEPDCKTNVVIAAFTTAYAR